MSQVAVQKVDTRQSLPPEIVDEMNSISERIRRHAYELFEGRSGAAGSEIGDWLAAERDLFRIPESELIDRDGRFEARLSAPGFDPSEIKVAALPDALVVKGSTTHKHDEIEKDLQFCEFDQRTLFRRFDLPERIDVDRVTANLDNGMLHVTATKSRQEAVPRNQRAA